MVSVTIKGVVDMMMVGKLGTDQLAGVGLAGVLVFNALCFGMGVLRGQKSLISQHLGAEQAHESFRYGVHGFYLSGVFALACLSLALVQDGFFSSIASATNLSQTALTAGSDYFDTRLAWSGSMFLSLAVGEYLRGTGRTRLPMVADLISQPVNILCNYALIFGHFGCPELGVQGAAIGTGIADLLTLVLLLVLSRKPGIFQHLAFSAQHLWRVVSVGVASGVQWTLEVGSYTLINFFISYLGTQEMAAHSATINIMHFSFMSAIALADGGSVLVGQAVGAKNWLAAQRTLRSMIGLALPVMMLIAGLFALFGEEIMGLYIDDPPTIALGAHLLLIAAVWQFGDAFQICCRFALRAAGDHTWVMWTGILCAWVLSAPAAAIAIWVLHGDVTTVWWCWNIEIFIGALIFWRRWSSGKWRQMRLVEDEEVS